MMENSIWITSNWAPHSRHTIIINFWSLCIFFFQAFGFFALFAYIADAGWTGLTWWRARKESRSAAMQAENAASPEPRYWHYYLKCNFYTEVDIHTFYYFKSLRVVACLSEVIFIEGVADKLAKYFSGHLVALWQNFGCNFLGSEHWKLPQKVSRHLVAFFVGRVSSNTKIFVAVCLYRIVQEK